MRTDLDVPMLPEEVDRKTIEHTEDIVARRAIGAISAKHAERSLQLIWSLTAGLASNDVSALVTQAHAEAQADLAKNPEPPETVLLYRPADGRLARISYDFDKPGYVVAIFTPEGVKHTTNADAEPGPARAAAVKNVITQLVKTGLRPLPTHHA